MNRSSILRLLILLYYEEVFSIDTSMSVYVCFKKGAGQKDGWCNSTLKLCNTGIADKISVNVNFSKPLTKCKDLCSELYNSSNFINITTIESGECSETLCNMTDFIIPIDSVKSGNGNDDGLILITYICTNNSEPSASKNHRNPIKTVSTSSSTTPNPSKTVSTASSTTHNPSKTVSTASSTTPNPSKTVSTASSTTHNPSKTVSTASSTTHNASSTTAASPGNEPTQAQISTGSDDSFPTAIVVSVVVSVIIVVLVVAFLMYRKGQCKQLLGKCTKGHRKHSPDRSDELVMGSMANANLTYDLSSVVDVNNYNEDYSEIDKVDKENYFEYSQVNLKRKQPVHSLTYNHIGHFDRSSEDAEHTYNHVGDETSQKSDWSTLQPDTYSHVGAMARPASGHLAEDSYAHINGVVKDLPAAYETNQYDCAVFQFNGGQTGNSGHRGNEIKSGKENKFIVVGPSKVDMNSDAPVSHSYFVLEKHEEEA